MANWAHFGHFHLGVYSLLWPAVYILDINGCVLSYFEGTANLHILQAVPSLLYIVAKCHFFSVVTSQRTSPGPPTPSQSPRSHNSAYTFSAG